MFCAQFFTYLCVLICAMLERASNVSFSFEELCTDRFLAGEEFKGDESRWASSDDCYAHNGRLEELGSSGDGGGER